MNKTFEITRNGNTITLEYSSVDIRFDGSNTISVSLEYTDVWGAIASKRIEFVVSGTTADQIRDQIHSALVAKVTSQYGN